MKGQQDEGQCFRTRHVARDLHREPIANPYSPTTAEAVTQAPRVWTDISPKKIHALPASKHAVEAELQTHTQLSETVQKAPGTLRWLPIGNILENCRMREPYHVDCISVDTAHRFCSGLSSLTCTCTWGSVGSVGSVCVCVCVSACRVLWNFAACVGSRPHHHR